MRCLQVVVVAALGAFGPAVAFADAPAAAKPTVKVERVADVRVVTALRVKDTAKVDVVTAGEKQKSTYGRCAAAKDVALCRILISAVNVAAILSNIPTK